MTSIASLPAEAVQSEALYSAIAGRYDEVFERAILAEGRLTEVVRETMTGRDVLDLGCGTARWLDRFSPSSYVGLDLNEKMLAEAAKRHQGARFVCGNMTALPFDDGAFDGVISMFGAMGHLAPDGQAAMVAEAGRVIAPGGMALFTNGNLLSPFALPTTLAGGRVKIEGVRVRVHSTTPRRFRRLLSESFEVLRLESYDFSYLPLLPLKFAACLIGRDYRPVYAHLMALLDNCRHIPTMRWFGKQLVAECRKRA
jgi:SAM-dependent methyltransferase